jgi:hypothetical protein
MDFELFVTLGLGDNSLLDRAGIPVRQPGKGGVPEWLARCHPRAGTA